MNPAIRTAGRTVFSVLAVLAVGVCVVSAQIDLPDWDSSVEFEVVHSQDRIRPGDRVELAVIARIEEGYHLYGPEEIEPSRTEVEIRAEGLSSEAPVYPQVLRRELAGLGTYDLYEGEIAIRVPVRFSDIDVNGGEHPVSVVVRYQVCTEFACSAPDSETLEIAIPVAARGTEVRGTHPEIFK